MLLVYVCCDLSFSVLCFGSQDSQASMLLHVSLYLWSLRLFSTWRPGLNSTLKYASENIFSEKYIMQQQTLINI